MTISSMKYIASKFSKMKTKKIGKRSIYDILNNKPIVLDFEEKVNYIRHKFTYYEGNYDLFNDSRGKPNKRKELLNKVISEVVLKHKDPSVLKKLNKKILLWRKNRDEKLKRNKQNEESKKTIDYRTHDWYMKAVINNGKPTIGDWEKVIVDFIKSPENNLEPDLLQHIRYKRLKEIVNIWINKKGMFVDYNSMLINKYPKEALIYNEKEM